MIALLLARKGGFQAIDAEAAGDANLRAVDK
jgi:hypothetical protein